MAQIEGMEWDEFLKWFDDEWEPGMHMALIGPTGQGKSNFASQVLKLRKWVLALDPKGGDETLQKSGFQRIKMWPPPSKVRDNIAEGKPARLIVGHEFRTRAEKDKLVQLLHDAVDGCTSDGGWTIYADEFQLLADRRMYGLDKDIETLLISARSRGTSVVTAFQAPAWVPKAGTRQARFIAVWKNNDRDMIQAIARACGRKWQDLADMVDNLPKFHVLMIPEDIDAPVVMTHPPKL